MNDGGKSNLMKKGFLSFSLTFVVLISFATISAYKSKQLIWVEFCDHGVVGKCLVKQGAGAGFRCYAADINEPKDCDGSHWEEL